MRETGGLPSKAGLETHVAAGECYEAAALTSRPLGEILPTPKPQMSVARRLPVGVVGVISPFNFPLILSIRSVAPALALGNTVLLKPGPRTSVTGGIMIARVLEEAGLPRGVLHVLPGAPTPARRLSGTRASDSSPSPGRRRRAERVRQRHTPGRRRQHPGVYRDAMAHDAERRAPYPFQSAAVTPERNELSIGSPT